jgi:hypothetical protein
MHEEDAKAERKDGKEERKSDGWPLICVGVYV